VPRNPDRTPTHADWEAVRQRREGHAAAIVAAVRERRWKDATRLVKAYDDAVVEMQRLDDAITARENVEALKRQ
jgi:hypothetical protein